MTLLLPFGPELHSRAETTTQARQERLRGVVEDALTPQGPILGAHALLVESVARELRDLSTPEGRDHGLRWLWEILTGEAPEWCPSWSRCGGRRGYHLLVPNAEGVWVIEPGPLDASGDFYAGAGYLALRGVSEMKPADALLATLVAALTWRSTKISRGST